jgi:hypothetical protein
MWIRLAAALTGTIVSDGACSRATGTTPYLCRRGMRIDFSSYVWRGWTGTSSDYGNVVVDRLATASTTSLTLERHVWVFAHEHVSD